MPQIKIIKVLELPATIDFMRWLVQERILVEVIREPMKNREWVCGNLALLVNEYRCFSLDGKVKSLGFRLEEIEMMYLVHEPTIGYVWSIHLKERNRG